MGSDETKQPEVTTTFGVSGYLMDSDVLIYDRATQSLWSQIGGAAIAGPRAGQTFSAVEVTDTTWGAWREAHPATEVLKGPKPATAYNDPYARYHAGEKLLFPPSHRSDHLPVKEVVTGVVVAGQAACWSHGHLKERALDRKKPERTQPLAFRETVGETTLLLRYDPEADTLTVGQKTEEGAEPTDPLVPMRMYWFAWYAFHPRTLVDGEAP